MYQLQNIDYLYRISTHEVFGKMTCRDWKNWLLDDAEPQFGIWF